MLAAAGLLAGRGVSARPLPEPQAALAVPSLAVAPLVSATAGQPVVVPLTFDNGGEAIDTIFFVLSYDATLLTLNGTDGNGDGVPDGVTMNLPAGYRVISTLEITAGEGQLEILIYNHNSLTESPCRPASC